jgi:hypothetical protein
MRISIGGRANTACVPRDGTAFSAAARVAQEQTVGYCSGVIA